LGSTLRARVALPRRGWRRHGGDGVELRESVASAAEFGAGVGSPGATPGTPQRKRFVKRSDQRERAPTIDSGLGAADGGVRVHGGFVLDRSGSLKHPSVGRQPRLSAPAIDPPQHPAAAGGGGARV